MSRAGRARWTPLVGPVLCLVGIIAVAIIIPSIVFSSPTGTVAGDVHHSISRAERYFLPDLESYGIVIVLTALVSIGLYHRFIWRRDYGHLIQPFMDYRIRRRLVPGLLICIVLTFVIIFFTAYSTNTSLISRIADNPGGWFAIVTGVVSVVGVYLTLASVLDVKNSIISFADFVYRTELLISETERSDFVRMMFHTPAPGCLVLPPEIWMKLARRIKMGDTLISMTCLTQNDMAAWFQEYTTGLVQERLDIMRKRIDIGLSESHLVKEAVDQRAKLTGDASVDVGVLEASWSDLPLCYYIANSRRAIVVAPFFLPRPGANIYAGNVHNRSVQMIGFETTDFHIVETVHQEIETRRNSIRSVGGSSTPAKDAA